MIWPPFTEALEGELVRLEPLDGVHRERLARAAHDERIWTWMDRRITSQPGTAFGEWFDARLRGREHGSEWGFATILRRSGEAIGSSSYLAARPEHNGVEIGWTWLNPRSWRTGANLEAKLLMLRFAFERLGCMRVEFKTDARNERSRAALAALPAQFEGIFRKHMLMPVTGVRDSAYFSITDDEWPGVEANLRLRLSRGGADDAQA